MILLYCVIIIFNTIRNENSFLNSVFISQQERRGVLERGGKVMEREKLLSRLRSVIKVNGHILAVAVGSGMTAQYVVAGGADLIVAINAGRIRQMGLSAFDAFFGNMDTNQMMLEFATKEILPRVDDFPVIAGVFMQDPELHLYEHLGKMEQYGFSGIINYPSVGLFDGHFREALEKEGMGYEKEIEGIRLAHFLGLFTLAYVFDENQAEQMVKAGADAICVHFGITGGGMLGANRVMSLTVAMKMAENIFQKVDAINPEIIKIVCGGPVQTPIDGHSFYQNTRCQGIMAGSAIERLPVERAMLNTIRAFKCYGDFDDSNIVTHVLNGTEGETDYAKFMKEYIEKNYGKYIRLKDLSVVAHLSSSRLSVLFREKYGTSFTNYLIDFRMKKAQEFLRETDKSIKDIASLVGYDDYMQFSKMFKKKVGMTPQQYKNTCK